MPSAYEGTDIISYLYRKYIIRQRRISYRAGDISLYDIMLMKLGESMSNFSMTKQKFINQWLRRFAKGISKNQLEKYVHNQFVWHIFSRELIKNDTLLVGDAARQAYNEAVKTDCIFCDMFGNGGVTDNLSPLYDTADKIDENLTEFYVVAKDYSWTYIKTHENEICGPYFFRVSD